LNILCFRINFYSYSRSGVVLEEKTLLEKLGIVFISRTDWDGCRAYRYKEEEEKSNSSF